MSDCRSVHSFLFPVVITLHRQFANAICWKCFLPMGAVSSLFLQIPKILQWWKNLNLEIFSVRQTGSRWSHSYWALCFMPVGIKWKKNLFVCSKLSVVAFLVYLWNMRYISVIWTTFYWGVVSIPQSVAFMAHRW